MRLLSVGAASSHDQAMIAIRRFFRGWKPLPRNFSFTAGTFRTGSALKMKEKFQPFLNLF
jgi:hypothetical protein